MEIKEIAVKKYAKKYAKFLWMLPVIMAVYLLLKYKTAEPVELLLAETMIVFGYVAAVWDAKKQIVPNKLVLLMLACWFVIVLPQIFISESNAVTLMITGLFGFLFGGGMMFVAYLISKKGMGGGDVKFIAAAGCYLGAAQVMVGVLFGSIAASVINLVLIARKKRKRTDGFPFVPYLYAGILVILFLN